MFFTWSSVIDDSSPSDHLQEHDPKAINVRLGGKLTSGGIFRRAIAIESLASKFLSRSTLDALKSRWPLYTLPKPPSPSKKSGLNFWVVSFNSWNVKAWAEIFPFPNFPTSSAIYFLLLLSALPFKSIRAKQARPIRFIRSDISHKRMALIGITEMMLFLAFHHRVMPLKSWMLPSLNALSVGSSPVQQEKQSNIFSTLPDAALAKTCVFNPGNAQ
nr:hypothetical protein ACMD2_01380 [Ipomoea batatas]